MAKSLFKKTSGGKKNFSLKVDEDLLERKDNVNKELKKIDESLKFDLNSELAEAMEKIVAQAESQIEKMKQASGIKTEGIPASSGAD